MHVFSVHKSSLSGTACSSSKNFKKTLAFQRRFDKFLIPFVQNTTDLFTAKSVTRKK